MELYNNKVIFMIVKLFLVSAFFDGVNKFFLYDKLTPKSPETNRTQVINNQKTLQEKSKFIKEDIELP